MNEMLKEVDSLKEILINNQLPLETKKSLDEDFKLRYTNDSNAIEGNTLTLFETKVVLEGMTIGGKSLKEHLETINHAHAIDFMLEMANSNTMLNTFDIKSLHQIVLQSIDQKNAGVYRNVDVIISGANHVPPSYINVVSEMERFLEWYQNEAQILHPIIRASRIHIDFVGIHPFVDGNGRMSRLLMNYELIKNNYPPINIKYSSKAEYFYALDEAHCYQHYEKFDNLVIREVKSELEKQIQFIKAPHINPNDSTALESIKQNGLSLTDSDSKADNVSDEHNRNINKRRM